MQEPKADILLHPVRIRIVQTVSDGGQYTVQQIGEVLQDVPQATLYRHLRTLAEAGFLQVVGERRAGGAMERVYSIVRDAVVLTADDLAQASRDDHMQYFTTFCMTLLSECSQYLQRPEIDPERDGFGYRSASLHLNDEELREVATAIRRAVEPYIHRPPSPDRRRILLSTILIPQQSLPDKEAPNDDPS